MTRRSVAIFALLTCSALVSSCRRQPRPPEAAIRDPLACATFIAGRVYPADPYLLPNVAVEYASLGDCQRAGALVTALSVSPPRGEPDPAWASRNLLDHKAHAIRRVAVACCQSSNPGAGRKLLETSEAEAQKVDQLLGNSEPPFWRYLYAVDLAKCGDADGALHLFEQVSQAPIPPGWEEWRFGSLRDRTEKLLDIAQALGQTHQESKAVELIEQAVAMAGPMRGKEKVNAYLRAAWSLFELRQPQKRERLLQDGMSQALEISDAAERAYAVAEVVKSYAYAGEFERALALSTKIEIGRDHVRSSTLREIALQLIIHDRLLRALTVLPLVTDEYDRSCVFTTLVAEYTRLGQLGQAAKMADAVAHNDKKTEAQCILAEGYAAHGQTIEAETILRRAREDLRLEYEKIPYPNAYEKSSKELRIAMAYVAIGKRDEALSMYRDVGHQTDSASFLTGPALDMISRRNYEMAIEIAKAIEHGVLITHVGEIDPARARAEILVKLLIEYARARRQGLPEIPDLEKQVLKTFDREP